MSRTLSQKLGKCVKDLRLKKGFTQIEFGEKCGFYQTYLSRIERGHANPSLNALEVIASALGLTVFELFDLVRGDSPKRRR